MQIFQEVFVEGAMGRSTVPSVEVPSVGVPSVGGALCPERSLGTIKAAFTTAPEGRSFEPSVGGALCPERSSLDAPIFLGDRGVKPLPRGSQRHRGVDSALFTKGMSLSLKFLTLSGLPQITEQGGLS